jgi:hypothetical protein
MPRVVKRSASQAVKSGRSRRDATLPPFVPPQLSQPVEKPPTGPQLVSWASATVAAARLCLVWDFQADECAPAGEGKS